MKKSHKPHVRRWLELAGTILLAFGVYSQRDILAKSLTAIRHAQSGPTLACFLLGWTLFIWSALGYKLLLSTPIKFRHIVLASLASSGPGRVIPGGAGAISIITLFLRKSGLKLSQALAVALMNNLTGLVVNTTVVTVIFLANPNLIASLSVSGKNLIIFCVIIAIIITGIIAAQHSKKLKIGTNNTGKELKKLWLMLLKTSSRFIGLICVMLVNMSTNSLMLYFAAHAVGLQLPLLSALVAMSTGVALGSLIPTPGGVGGVEAGLIVSMHALGFNLEMATSAALLYRAATYLQPFIPGVGAYLHLRSRELL